VKRSGDFVISLKRYIDSEHTSAALLRALVDAYQGTLRAVAESATKAYPSFDSNLEQQMTVLGQQMAGAETADAITATGTRVSTRLQYWAERAEDDLRRKTADVKELLVTLAHTAATVAASDAEHVMRFDTVTARLETIATLEDVTQLKSAVLASAEELRASVEAMSTSTRASLQAMQSELDAYQLKLEAAEKTAAQDPLTGLMNRRKIEMMIERRIQRGKPFSVGLIDLDGFKDVNDRLGHGAGDDLLRQFSADLKANARPTDAVGRWGGDEFILIVDGVAAEARTHFERMKQWLGGSYSLEGAHGKAKVNIDLSIGITEWRQGTTAGELLEEADARMYATKRSQR
jgi:diguanylate cyclase (GGDEF)-like protein